MKNSSDVPSANQLLASSTDNPQAPQIHLLPRDGSYYSYGVESRGGNGLPIRIHHAVVLDPGMRNIAWYQGTC